MLSVQPSKVFVAYFRVSTQAQGRSGLGLEAQRAVVASYLSGRGEVIAEFLEVESGKGSNALDRRPQLRNALAVCGKTGATLLIAKLDRLARNVHFVAGLLETGCDFVAADMPHASKVMIHIHAAMSEHERDQISDRTRAALAAARARGVKLGTSGAANLRPNLEARQAAADQFALKLSGQVAGFRGRGLSQREIMRELNSVGIKAPRGGTWSLAQVQRLLKHFPLCAETESTVGLRIEENATAKIKPK